MPAKKNILFEICDFEFFFNFRSALFEKMMTIFHLK